MPNKHVFALLALPLGMSFLTWALGHRMGLLLYGLWVVPLSPSKSSSCESCCRCFLPCKQVADACTQGRSLQLSLGNPVACN